jgi:translin
MEKLTAGLELIAEKARAVLSSTDAAREKALRLSRDAQRYSTDAIRSVHRGDYEEARERLSLARELLKELDRELDGHPELQHAGFVYSAQKEHVEGYVTLGLIVDNTLPDPDEFGVGYAAYLNGLGEAVGELRRHILDIIRKGELERCENLLEAMDDIYCMLATMDFPDAMTGGLRRTTDAVRGILERTRGDMTIALRQQQLEEKLNKLEKKLT